MAEWLYARGTDDNATRDLTRLHVSLGHCATSFWAADGESYIWDGLPKELEESLASLRNPDGWQRTPKLVVLGADEDFFLMTDDGFYAWELKNYAELDTVLNVLNKAEVLHLIQVLVPRSSRSNIWS